MDDLKVDETNALFGMVTSEELIQSLAASAESLINSIPVGQISPIYIYNVAGFILPDPNLWLECNGQIITNKNSILYNPETPDDLSSPIDESKVARVPNLANRYIKMSYGEDGEIGGVNTFKLNHNHTGWTGYFNHPESGEHSNEKDTPYQPHRHTIESDLNSSIPVEPPFTGIKFYMRIL